MSKTDRDDDADGSCGNSNYNGGVGGNDVFDTEGGGKSDNVDEETEQALLNVMEVPKWKLEWE